MEVIYHLPVVQGLQLMPSTIAPVTPLSVYAYSLCVVCVCACGNNYSIANRKKCNIILLDSAVAIALAATAIFKL